MVSPTLRQTFVVTGMLFNIFGHGSLHGYPAILIAQFRDEQGLRLTATDISWIGSVLGMSKIFGSLLSLAIMNWFGRKKALLASTIPAILGWVVYFSFNSVPFFIVARILHGISLGLRVSSCGILMAEYTDPVLRGRFLGSTAVFVASGILFSHVLGGLMTWKTSALMCSVSPLISLLMLLQIPESPSWLASKGRLDEARKTFVWLRGDGHLAQKELEEIIENQKTSTVSQGKNWRESAKRLRNKAFYQPTIVAMCIYLIYEFGGSHIVPTYGNLILKKVLSKKNTNEVRWHLTALDVLRLLSNFCGIFLLKYLKRRVIILTSGVMTIFSLLSITFFIHMVEANMIPSDLMDALPMSLMVIYIVSFNLGFVPIMWVIVGEIFPLAYRSLGSTVAGLTLTPSSIIALKTAPLLFESIGVEGAFLTYSVVLAACLGIIFPLLPETKDRTLQEIENTFAGKVISKPDVNMDLIRK